MVKGVPGSEMEGGGGNKGAFGSEEREGKDWRVSEERVGSV